ncbi:hypothetical protein [Streptodolium elevatio]|uniref:Uncharacterized protein n=1 Tax=Streptodolium elevatio TaxID=3157996 RepID=A0ABV3DPH6_9ACTN
MLGRPASPYGRRTENSGRRVHRHMPTGQEHFEVRPARFEGRIIGPDQNPDREQGRGSAARGLELRRIEGEGGPLTGTQLLIGLRAGHEVARDDVRVRIPGVHAECTVTSEPKADAYDVDVVVAFEDLHTFTAEDSVAIRFGGQEDGGEEDLKAVLDSLTVGIQDASVR